MELNEHQWERVAVTLESDGTADDLIAAALIRRATLGDSLRALADLDRAMQLAPRQPDAAWLALIGCADVRDCSQAQRRAQLLELDPRNAAASYAALTEARANADVAAEDLALASMADAKYFDVYWSRLIARAAAALAQPRGPSQHPLRELPLAANEVVGWLAAVAIPPFSATSSTCKGDRLKRDAVVEWCRKLAVALDDGDTYIAQSIGRAIATRVWEPGSIEFARFSQRKREYSYIQELIRPYDLAVHDSTENTQRWLDRLRANRSEHDAYREWLIELGIPADPPADWEPEGAQAQPDRKRIAVK